MPFCQACGIEIMNGRALCKRCSQDKRSLRHWAYLLDKLMDETLFPERLEQRKKDRIVIAS